MTKFLDVKPLEGAEPQIGLLLQMLDENTRKWRSELGRVSKEAVGWQPFPNSHSIGLLILHIADVEAHWLQEVAAGRPRTPEETALLLSDETQQYRVQWPKPPVRPLAWYFAQQDAVRARTRETVLALGSGDHIGTRGSYGFTLRWLLHHVITHEAYHGGQAVFLSLLWKAQQGQAKGR